MYGGKTMKRNWAREVLVTVGLFGAACENANAMSGSPLAQVALLKKHYGNLVAIQDTCTKVTGQAPDIPDSVRRIDHKSRKPHKLSRLSQSYRQELDQKMFALVEECMEYITWCLEGSGKMKILENAIARRYGTQDQAQINARLLSLTVVAAHTMKDKEFESQDQALGFLVETIAGGTSEQPHADGE
jgi:hypothetical protein